MNTHATVNHDAPCGHRYANPIPFREHPLILDRSEYADLLDRLISELRPPNALAERLVQQLAQELLKLQFSQRVEFALIDQAQHVDDAGLRRSREYMDMRCKGKRPDQCGKELAMLVPARQALQAGAAPRLDEAGLRWVADVMWGRITMYEDDCAEARAQIEGIEAELERTSDVEEGEYLASVIEDEKKRLDEATLENKQAGRDAHGVETKKDVLAVFAGRSPVPDGKQDRWVETIGERIAIVTEQRNLVLQHEHRMEALRCAALGVAADRIPQLMPIQQHSAGVWRNIERCIKQLATLGMDLKSKAMTLGATPNAEGSPA